jgi:hypothetical protein
LSRIRALIRQTPANCGAMGGLCVSVMRVYRHGRSEAEGELVF